MEQRANSQTDHARQFHNATKYTAVDDGSGERQIMMGEPPHLKPSIGEQDPALEPFPFKIYTSLDPIPLPREPLETTVSALDALSSSGARDASNHSTVPDLAAIARCCLLSNGILKRGQDAPSGRDITYRAAGCTGARYHLELYLVCADLPDLPAGVYHYAAHDHTLRSLRRGDHRATIVAATGEEASVAQAPVIAICTSTFWRNAWRYQERAYRHVYWDTGTLFANILAVAASDGLPAAVVLGYDDAQINVLLDIDGEREAAVALIALGQSDQSAPAAPAHPPLTLPTHPISSREIDFPLIRTFHRASSLTSGDEARGWHPNPLHVPMSADDPAGTPLTPLASDQRPADSIADVIQRRRSNRRYAAETPLPFDLFSTVLATATAPAAIDALDPAAPPLYQPYLIVNNVEGLAAGTYLLHPTSSTLEPLAKGDFRHDAARLAYGQDYAADAHVNVYALTDLDPVLAHYGNRGYRLAQFEAALFAGRLQLAAHALGLGAVGSTSIDDDVTTFFSPRAATTSFMFIAVFGVKRRAQQ